MYNGIYGITVIHLYLGIHGRIFDNRVTRTSKLKYCAHDLPTYLYRYTRGKRPRIFSFDFLGNLGC